MAAILFCPLPLASAMNASLAIAKALRLRGHRVAFCGMKDAEAIVAPHGFENIAVFEDWFPQGFVRTWVKGGVDRGFGWERLRFLLDERRRRLRHEAFINFLIKGGIEEFPAAVAPFAPDLILIDSAVHTHWALAAYRTGTPCAYLNQCLPGIEDPVVPPLHSQLPPATDAAGGQAVEQAWDALFASRRRANLAARLTGVTDWIEHLTRLAAACGYPSDRFNTRTELMPVLDLPILTMCPDAFEFPQALGRPGRHYVEAAIDLTRQEPPFPWDALDPSRALVYVSLGSIAFSQSFLQRVIDAAAAEPGWQLVVNLGTGLDASAFTGVPSNAILVKGTPQLRVIERAAVMINHAGIGTVKECIYHGVPQVAFPIFFDQPGAAARIRYHGIGVVGDFATSTSKDIRDLVRRALTDERIRDRAAAMSRTFREVEERQPSMAVIEHLCRPEAR